MNLGFTGSRVLMTLAQQVQIEQYVYVSLRPHTVHHGDCIGSDYDFDTICRRPYMKQHPLIHIHSPRSSKFRAFCGSANDVIHPEDSYMKRNQRIVDFSDALIATPHGPEKVRSGTWATVRRARKKGIPIYIVYPDGRIELQ